MREETTDWTTGMCRRCGWPLMSLHENGPACDKCGRRVVLPEVSGG